MAYRRPGVTVTQQFVGLTPALAAFQLPSCVVGPAYQLVAADSLGAYSGTETTYSYLSLVSGGQVDTAFPIDNDPVAATKLPINAVLKNTYVQVTALANTGVGSGTAFSDPTTNAFLGVLPGDIVVVKQDLAETIISAQTNGVSTMASPGELTAGTAGQFASVEVGDSVTVTGTSPSIAGTVTVTAVAGDTLVLSGAVNDGTADSSAVHYSVTGNRGVQNAGTYPVKTVTDANHLVLTSPLVVTEQPLDYMIKRLVPATATTAAGTVVLTRLAAPAATGFTADGSGVTLPASMTVTVGVAQMLVVAGDLYADYRALRNDLAADVKPYTDIADITAVFGANQITPQNPLAFAIETMLSNSVTETNALGLDGNAVTNEALSHTNASEVMQTVDMYAIAVLSQNPVVHQIWSAHVTGMSAPDVKLERVALVNSLLVTEAVLQDEETTVTTVNNSRIIVNTQLDGTGAVAQPSTLNSPHTGRFTGVAKGDLVVVVGGTNVTPGQYPVLTVPSGTQLTVTGTVITSGSPTDIEFYIVRQDGLDADGTVFYDRNAAFLSNGVAAGHFLTIESGALAGRYKIGTVTSNTQLSLAAAVPGVVTLQKSIDYRVDRDLSKDEQATLIAGYSESFANRRLVHCWPDLVQVPLGQEIVNVPGYYLGCAIAALTTGLPTQQGFTNLSVTGFLGFQHSSRYFTGTQLDTVAAGGTMVFAQDGPQQALYVRHQLTTDMSAIKFQEYSITKNVDYIAKFTRSAFAKYPGRYNIVDTTTDDLKGTAGGVIKFLKEDTVLPRIGGVIRSGTLSQLAPGANIDSLAMRFQFNIPIPLNNLDITVQV